MKMLKGVLNVIPFLLALFVLLFFSGCMSLRDSESVGNNVQAKEKFSKKKVAILPIKAESSFFSDTSILPLRTEITKALDTKVKEELSSSSVIDTNISGNILNDNNQLNDIDALVETYNNTGVIDKKVITSLGSTLKSDYIVLSKLSVSRMDLSFLGKGFAASLEIYLVDVETNEITWAGIGDFKKGGVFGFGSIENKQAAEELVSLAFRQF